MVEAISSTLEARDVSMKSWDVIVVGAGIAGATVAMELADRKLDVLLIDAKEFPREKVCGGCLNLRAQSILEERGIVSQVLNRGAQVLDRYSIRVGKRSACWPMPRMVSVSRGLLDGMLVQMAIAKGTQFLAPARVTLGGVERNARTVQLQQSTFHWTARARVIVAADGLTQSSLRELPEFQSTALKDSRIGIQSIVSRQEWNATIGDQIDERTLQMFLGREGYVGVAPIDEDRVDIAAAISPGWITRNQRPQEIMARILKSCGLSCEGLLSTSSCLATPALSRRSTCVASERVFLVGDAVGYIEPFTGEGMSWALAGAQALVPWVENGVKHWSAELIEGWRADLKDQVLRYQSWCKWYSRVSRYPKLASGLVSSLHWLPWIRRTVMQQISGQSAMEVYKG